MTDFSNINLVSQPKDMNVTLFPHQLSSIYRMENLEINNIIEKENYVKETKIGINADITGFGKSLSMLGLISRDKMEWDLETPFVFETITVEARGRIKNYYISRYDKLPSTLILASQSLIGQWVKEIVKTNLTYKSLISRKDIDDLDLEDKNYDIIIVSPTMYNKLISKYKGYAWKRFIFDEPGHLKVSSMKEIHAGFYWFVTATPNSIMSQHRNCRGSFIKDLFCQYYYMDFETQYNDIIIKNDPEFVKASFEMPPTTHYNYNCFQPVFNAVSGFVNSTISTMIEAGNIEGAIESLGGGKTGNIIELVKQKKFEELEEIDSKIRIYTMRNDQTKIDEWKTRKIRVLGQIDELDNRFQLMLNSPCNICFDDLVSPVLEPNCQNLFCGECLLKWLRRKNTCPLCRSDIDLSTLIYVDTGVKKSVPNIKEERKMTKEEKIIDIIKNKEDGMFLIFSEYDNTFYQIYKILRENNIDFVEIKGSIKTRERNLELFRVGKIPVIFLNSNYNGSGINLTEATDIILYHEMNSYTENQIIGRANRIGRLKPLSIHHLQVSSYD